jgi:hypothetical protein
MFRTLYGGVLRTPTYRSLASNLTIIFRPQIQPWHPSSTLVHEAALAVQQVRPDKFWEFSERLFDQQKDYFDVGTRDEPRNETYRRLAELAGGVEVGVLYLCRCGGEEGG